MRSQELIEKVPGVHIAIWTYGGILNRDVDKVSSHDPLLRKVVSWCMGKHGSSLSRFSAAMNWSRGFAPRECGINIFRFVTRVPVYLADTVATSCKSSSETYK